MTAVLDLIPSVMAQATSAPEPVVARAYVDAAREFFRKTLAWTDAVSVGTPAVGTDEYNLVLPTDSEVVDGVYVRYMNDEKSLVKYTRAMMLMRATRTDSRPRWYRVTNSKIFFGPDTGEDISSLITAVILSLRPTLTAETIPDEIADKFHEYLEAGALYRLLTMPGKAWSDPATAGVKLAQFNADIDEWKARAPDDGMTGIARQVVYGGL